MSLPSAPALPSAAGRRAAAVRPAGAAAGLAALLVLTGCGSGQRAQTYQERTVAEATNSAIGAIAVRNVAVSAPTTGTTYAPGSSAPVTLTLVNQGAEDDVLLQATTPAASSVEVTGPTPQLLVPRLSAADPTYSLMLTGLTRELATSQYIELALAFERNGSKTLLVPVQVTPEQVARTDGTYKVAETDSEGNPLPEEEQRPELDTDGGEAPEGDAAPEGESDPEGDNAGDAPVGE